MLVPTSHLFVLSLPSSGSSSGHQWGTHSTACPSSALDPAWGQRRLPTPGGAVGWLWHGESWEEKV